MGNAGEQGAEDLGHIGGSLRTGHIRNEEALSLAGRANHYSEMVQGRYNRCLLIHLGDAEAEDDVDIKILRQTKLCMVWWLEFLVNTALELHTDAAGGASSKHTQGWGVVNLKKGEWARGSWPSYILNNTWHRGGQVGAQADFPGRFRRAAGCASLGC